ncbi:hypothetical protein RSJ42_05995 [Methanosarcina hadiensis]
MAWKGKILPVNYTTGIIGAGHLGKTLAQVFIECGLPEVIAFSR